MFMIFEWVNTHYGEKMKKFIPVLVMMLFATIALFAGCSSRVDVPSSSDPVSGNGGLSVIKGDYIFYVNGYESNDTTKEGHKNKEGKVEVSSIYAAKLTNGEISDKRQLVSKVGGFEYSDLYVFGDKLYFLTPNTKKDETGEMRTDIITLCSINFDGSKLTEIFTPEQYSSGAFSMKEIDGKVYAFVYDGDKLSQINISDKNKVTTVAEGVTSFATSRDKTTYSENAQKNLDSSLDGFLFYSRSRTESEGSEASVGGNILEKYDVVSGDKTIISSNIASEITVSSVEGGRLFYKKGDYYYSSNLSSTSEIRHTYVSVDGFTPLGKGDNGSDLGIVISYNSKLYLQKLTDSVLPTTPLSEDNLTLLSFDGDKLIVKDENSNILSLSVLDKATTTLFEKEEDQTLGDMFDFDGRYIVMLANVEDYNSNYSYIVDTFLAEGGQTSAVQIGNAVDSDKSAE